MAQPRPDVHWQNKNEENIFFSKKAADLAVSNCDAVAVLVEGERVKRLFRGDGFDHSTDRGEC